MTSRVRRRVAERVGARLTALAPRRSAAWPLPAVVFAIAHCAGADAAHGGDAVPTDGADAGGASGDAGGAGGDASAAHGAVGGSDLGAGEAGEAASHASDAASSVATPCSALPLCDGFESAAAGGPPDARLWSVTSPDCSGSGTLAVDGTVAHGGTHSVKIAGGGGYCDHVFLGNASVVASLGSQVYARVFVRVSAPLGAGHVTFLAMKDGGDEGGDLRFGGQNAVLIYNRQSDDATLPTLSPTGTSDSVALAADAWTCVELHVDETVGTIETWVDGRAIAGLTENGTPTPDVSTQWLSPGAWRPVLSDLRLGWESYSGQAMTVWFDDVALAGQRIGCGS